jgi:hypothetical protein
MGKQKLAGSRHVVTVFNRKPGVQTEKEKNSLSWRQKSLGTTSSEFLISGMNESHQRITPLLLDRSQQAPWPMHRRKGPRRVCMKSV